MARLVSKQKKPARRTSISKAKLRDVGENAVQHPKHLSRSKLEEIVTKRPRVDFTDSLMRHSAMQAKGISLCAFLVTLAAFQRGLKVTFHYEMATKIQKFRHAIMQGHRGELFTISNGDRTHTFSRTLGDLIPQEAINAGEDKHLTKATLRSAGVRTPQGIVVSKEQTALIEKFVRHNSDKLFVVKPYNGTLGRDVHTGLEGHQVIEKVKLIPDNRLIIEEHIEGLEYRVFVVGYRFVASFLRAPASVIGDGESNIEKLISIKNEKRKLNPRLTDDLISDMSAVSKFLASTGRSLETIPGNGEKVGLLDTSSVLAGGDPVDTTHEKIGDLAEMSEAACKAMDIAVSGLDVIVREENGQKVAYVLELNQKPHISAQPFPMDSAGSGNLVAEAIIDYYFPETVNYQTRPRLTYDFSVIRNALHSAQISEISLPLVPKDWSVMRIEVQGNDRMKTFQSINAAAKISGVYVIKAEGPNDTIQMCISYSAVVFNKFLSLLPEPLRKPIAEQHVKQNPRLN